jgi:hypothetical protein
VTIWVSEPISPLNDLWNHVVVTPGAVPLSGHRLPPEKDFSRNVTGLRELLAHAGGLESAADEVSWTFRIDAEDLWLAVEAGIATIGATYRQQNHAGRHAMRASYEESTGLGGLEFVSTALAATARVASVAFRLRVRIVVVAGRFRPTRRSVRAGGAGRTRSRHCCGG